MKEIKIAYIGGGSRGWARSFMSDLTMEAEIKANVYLYDIDFESAKDNEIIAKKLFSRMDIVGNHSFIAVKTLQEALIGCDFVIISVLPATFNEMKSDVELPKEYGIYQAVGDTTGPGGIVRALRTIPIFRGFAEAIKMYCPKAWVINYTNPMSMCVKTLYEVFPKIKAFGCCHEVFGTQELLSHAFEEETGIKIKRNEVKITVSGINHFTWITEAKYGEHDLMQSYKKFVDKYYESGYQESSSHWANNSFVCFHRVKFDLYLRYGAIAAAGDRHLSEFCPGDWYLKNPEQVSEWMFGLTGVDWRFKDCEQKKEKTKKFVMGEEEFEPFETGEEGIHMIKAILGLGDFVTNCNMPNHGQAQGFDEETIVETNAVFSKDSVKPVPSGKLDEPVLQLVRRVASAQNTVVKAALEYDYDRVFNCFLNDPLVRLPIVEAKKLFIEMIKNTKAYIPESSKYLEKNS